MITTSYILKLHSDRDISLPKNGVVLLTALDEALEDKSFDIIYKGNYDAKVTLGKDEGGKFATFILFELNETPELTLLIEQIKELISYACSPEVVEASPDYQLVRIDSCPVNFKL